ncbi:glycosyltransferase family 2 protein [Halodurantibacterium flavum]|uniref:Glycosyltransferase family 2 protein n=1 Tax=Halodurantibacterium flavum TaxID=1382802 RepID=A0ABW4S7T9_9RHOB
MTLGLVGRYGLRLKRKQFLLRAFRKRRELSAVADRTKSIRRNDVLLFCTLRNERIRLPYFLEYYRGMGINHFLFVENASDDGTREYLADQPDVSIWTTSASYKRSRFGVDWLGWLLRTYGDGHWTLVVDADEFFIYPFCDTRPIQALTDWLDASSVRSFSAMLLDLYPRGGLNSIPYREGQDPLEITSWFDSGNYTFTRNTEFGHLWIQGGPRARLFFRDAPERAPALNKIPLVKWDRRYAYVSSTHMLLPRGLNRTYDREGGELASGCLLHAKFISTFPEKSVEELERRQHYAGSHEYRAYHEGLHAGAVFWCEASERYTGWRQLEILGLMSKGSWV